MEYRFGSDSSFIKCVVLILLACLSGMAYSENFSTEGMAEAQLPQAAIDRASASGKNILVVFGDMQDKSTLDLYELLAESDDRAWYVQENYELLFVPFGEDAVRNNPKHPFFREHPVDSIPTISVATPEGSVIRHVGVDSLGSDNDVKSNNLDKFLRQ